MAEQLVWSTKGPYLEQTVATQKHMLAVLQQLFNKALQLHMEMLTNVASVPSSLRDDDVGN